VVEENWYVKPYGKDKLMNSLDTICQTMLDNADLSILLQDYPFGMQLIFYIVGTKQKVIFRCKRIAKFEIIKEPDEEPLYAVLKVEVKQINRFIGKEYVKESISIVNYEPIDDDLPESPWIIQVVEGSARVGVLCADMVWSIEEISTAELEEYDKVEFW